MPTKSHKSITKTKLPNGLTVMLKEMHAAPVTSLSVWYRVGSRNEHVGITGISHWVEHMMFKGTERYNETEMDRLVSREGGTRNAFTWIDFTTYYETMPASKIDLAIDIESDRMMNTRFDPRETASERTVIINERQMYENSPVFRLAEEVQATAFRVHPYGHEVIGHMADLQRMTLDDLVRHYRTYYAPSNAIVCVAGAFNSKEMLAKLGEKFGAIPARERVPDINVAEPAQRGERRVLVKGEGMTNYLMMSFHAPAAKHDDFFALVALDSVLCGASGLAFFGGGTSNRSSRLSKALVDTGLSVDINGGLAPTIDPNLYSFMCTAQPGVAIHELENALWAQIEQVKTQGITQAELDIAIKQTRAQFAFNTESVTNQAFWMGFSEIVADYNWFKRYVEYLSAVTIDDVKRVAHLYLNRDNVTVGHYLGQGL
jgi:zinc protease